MLNRRVKISIGVLYLLLIVVSVLKSLIWLDPYIVSGDILKTSQNIQGSAAAYYSSICVEAIILIMSASLAFLLYVLLRKSHDILAKCGLFFRSIDLSIFSGLIICNFLAILVLTDEQVGAIFAQDQLYWLSGLFRKVYYYGYDIALMFFGISSLAFTYTFYKTEFLPKVISGVGIIGSILLVICTLIVLARPDLSNILAPYYYYPITLFEALAGLWLIFKK